MLKGEEIVFGMWNQWSILQLIENVLRLTIYIYFTSKQTKCIRHEKKVFEVTIFLGHSISWNYLKAFVILSLSQWDYLKLCKNEWIWFPHHPLFCTSFFIACPYKIYMISLLYISLYIHESNEQKNKTKSRFDLPQI